MNDRYENRVKAELVLWQASMEKKPSMMDGLTRSVQKKVNAVIPEKLHERITAVIKTMVQAVLFASEKTNQPMWAFGSLDQRDEEAYRKLNFYKTTAAVEGGITGAGGILMGLADFPLLLSLKIKLLYELAAIYGFDTNQFEERLYLLHIFELAFSSQQHRNQIFEKVKNWQQTRKNLPQNENEFDWRSFQQEYRDYIDLAKMAQLIPVIGAPVGYFVNRKLTRLLGETAINAYRMRIIYQG